jgi:hypothetical protein
MNVLCVFYVLYVFYALYIFYVMNIYCILKVSYNIFSSTSESRLPMKILAPTS